MNKFPIITEFASAEVPVFLEKKNKNIVFFGADNLYPFELIDLYNDSSTHNAIVNGKVGYIVGNGLDSEDIEVKKWLSQANIDQDWTSLMKSLTLDYEIFNGYAIEVIKTSVGNQYHHIDFANIRVSLDGQILYADDWITDKGIKNSRPDIQYLERYNPRDPNQKRGVIYHVDYRPNLKHYPLPVYVGSLAEIRTDVQIGDYWLSEISNGFVGGTLIQHNNGVPETKEEAKQFEDVFKEKFGGATGTKIVHLFSPSKENGSEITNLNGNDLHERYMNMSERVKESIFIGHRVTNPILFGVKEQNSLGSRSELDLAYEIFTNTYIAERQNTLLRTIKKLAFYEIQRSDIEIIPLKPIDTVDLTSDIILANLSREEIRTMITDQTGLELEEEITPTVASDFASIVQDGKPLYDTIEEAERVAEQLGCEGYHEHKIDGKTWYMPCSTHSETSDKSLEEFESYNDYPDSASNNAKRALKWADENGWGSCGTNVGKRRANQLAKKQKLSRETIARMASFKRHQQHKDVPYSEGCGGLMWDAWGGTSGIEWAISKLKQIDKKKMSACSCFSNDEDKKLLDNLKKKGVKKSEYEVIESLDIHFDSNGRPKEFATPDQNMLRSIIKLLQDNPKITAIAIAKALDLGFDDIVNYLLALTSDGIIGSENTEITLTNLGDKLANGIKIPKAEIKYQYQLRSDAPALKKNDEGVTIGESRKFCQDMIDLDRYWSKEEIERLNNDMTPDDFSNAANVWLARGGWYQPIEEEGEEKAAIPYCRHEWNQVIVRKKDNFYDSTQKRGEDGRWINQSNSVAPLKESLTKQFDYLKNYIMKGGEEVKNSHYATVQYNGYTVQVRISDHLPDLSNIEESFVEYDVDYYVNISKETSGGKSNTLKELISWQDTEEFYEKLEHTKIEKGMDYDTILEQAILATKYITR